MGYERAKIVVIDGIIKNPLAFTARERIVEALARPQ
jgi:hypothetical protein